MSLHRKMYSRSSRASYNNNSSYHSSSSLQSQHNDFDINNHQLLTTPLPKHLPFPGLPQESELLHEFLIFFYTIIASAMQFLHIYRTVWWLPNSYRSEAMNFHLIDQNLVIFITVVLGRRFIFSIMIKLVEMYCPKQILENVKAIIRFVYFEIILLTLAFCCIIMYQKHSYSVIFFLPYPFILYTIIFGLHTEPFLRTTFPAVEPSYFNGSPMHCCSGNPCTIRSEIDALRIDFYNRIKQIVFTSLLNTYYAGVIPISFTQSFVAFDSYWTVQHVCVLLILSITMCTVHCFPPNYCDVLHRSVLHLGQWIRIENSTDINFLPVWSKFNAYLNGTYVQYLGECFKSSGIVTTAVPGNCSHHKMFLFFKNPSKLYTVIGLIQFFMATVQLLMLYLAVEWQNMISMSCLLLANYHTLFKITRNYFVTKRVYDGIHLK